MPAKKKARHEEGRWMCVHCDVPGEDGPSGRGVCIGPKPRPYEHGPCRPLNDGSPNTSGHTWLSEEECLRRHDYENWRMLAKNLKNLGPDEPSLLPYPWVPRQLNSSNARLWREYDENCARAAQRKPLTDYRFLQVIDVDVESD